MKLEVSSAGASAEQLRIGLDAALEAFAAAGVDPREAWLAVGALERGDDDFPSAAQGRAIDVLGEARAAATRAMGITGRWADLKFIK